MPRKPETTRYCCACRSSTRWVLEKRQDGDIYRCIGDDEKHPERRVHGCGTAVVADKFMTNSNPVQR